MKVCRGIGLLTLEETVRARLMDKLPDNMNSRNDITLYINTVMTNAQLLEYMSRYLEGVHNEIQKKIENS